MCKLTAADAALIRKAETGLLTDKTHTQWTEILEWLVGEVRPEPSPDVEEALALMWQRYYKHKDDCSGDDDTDWLDAELRVVVTAIIAKAFAGLDAKLAEAEKSRDDALLALRDTAIALRQKEVTDE